MENKHCCNCNAILLKSVGQKMEIKSEFVRETVTRLFGKTVAVGNVLCNKCRVSFYKKKSEETERERREQAGSCQASNLQDAEGDPSHVASFQDAEADP